MKTKRIAILVAALLCCLSCVETNSTLGIDLIPKGQKYTFFTAEFPIEDIQMLMADSLSGYSDKRITVGAIRDEEYGLSSRSSVLTLIPIFRDKLDLGTNPIFKNFHLSAAIDTTSFTSPEQQYILQTINVYELSAPLDEKVAFDCNHPIERKDTRINDHAIICNGSDSLSFDFSQSFGERFLSLKDEDVQDISSYLEKFPGIVIEAEDPKSNGGRINIFDLQLDFNSEYGFFAGNFARLSFNSEFNGERRDTSLIFYFGAKDFYNVDSLFTNASQGAFPQYSLNLSSQQTAALEGAASDKVYIQGGGGLKPVIKASELKRLVTQAVSSKGGDPKTAVINKATLVLPFEFPDDYTQMKQWPQMLSPTCKIMDEQSGTTSFMGLTDSSSESENQGDIDRSNLQYAPDITYHLQSLLRIDESDEASSATKRYKEGSLDIWFLIMANEITTTTTSGSSDMSEYYNYLAYQSYYNNMYGGYGGYGGYGYGGYGGYGYNNYYSNYYSYAMMAAAANQSHTTQSVSVQLDKDRYYKAALNGPASTGRTPKLKITFGIPEE